MLKPQTLSSITGQCYCKSQSILVYNRGKGANKISSPIEFSPTGFKQNSNPKEKPHTKVRVTSLARSSLLQISIVGSQKIR